MKKLPLGDRHQKDYRWAILGVRPVKTKILRHERRNS